MGGDSEYTDKAHKWLNNEPTKAGDAAGSGIDVETDGVKLFGVQAREEAQDFMQSSGDGVQSLRGAASRIGRTFQEAQYFSTQHEFGLQRLDAFTKDAMKGLTALGLGAMNIATTYRNGDAASAATLNDVDRAFDVAGGNGLLTEPNGAGALPQAGASSGPALLPKAQALTEEQRRDSFVDANDRSKSQTINLGDRDTYTVPAAGEGDLELLDPADMRATLEQQTTTG